MKEDISVEKLRKIEALRKGGSTEGEREAAAAALERVKSNLPLRITCTIIHVDKQEAFYEVQYRDVEGRPQTRKVPREYFLRPPRVVEDLLKAGAALPDDQTAAVKNVKDAIELKAAATRRVTERSGWYEVESFLGPDKTYGKLAGQIEYLPPRELDPALGLSAGSLEAWREGLRAPCQHSDYLIIVIGHKASNALLEVIGEDEGWVLHLHGTESDSAEKTASSSGKTLMTRVAASMTGRCQRTDLITFGITEAALCDLCSARSHLGVELDEEGRALGSGTGPRVKADQLSYLISSGRGGVRSNYATRRAELKNRTWLSNAITSGETPLDVNSKRQARTEGSQVRMIGLPVPPGARGGVFNRVKGGGKKRAKRCQQLAEDTEATIAANHCVFFPALLDATVPIRATLRERINRRVAKLVEKVGADTNPWERRFAHKLATAGATAVLLSELGIAPWTKKRAVRAYVRLYRKARAATATVDEIAERVISALRRSLSKGKFPKVRKGVELSARTVTRAQRGFRKELPGLGLVLLIPMERIEQRIEKFFGRRGIASLVVQRLSQRGVVHLGGDGKLTREVMAKEVAEGRHRYVCFDLARLTGGEK
jgi:hypothetical protein